MDISVFLKMILDAGTIVELETNIQLVATPVHVRDGEALRSQICVIES